MITRYGNDFGLVRKYHAFVAKMSATFRVTDQETIIETVSSYCSLLEPAVNKRKATESREFKLSCREKRNLHARKIYADPG